MLQSVSRPTITAAASMSMKSTRIHDDLLDDFLLLASFSFCCFNAFALNVKANREFGSSRENQSFSFLSSSSSSLVVVVPSDDINAFPFSVTASLKCLAYSTMALSAGTTVAVTHAGMSTSVVSSDAFSDDDEDGSSFIHSIACVNTASASAMESSLEGMSIITDLILVASVSASNSFSKCESKNMQMYNIASGLEGTSTSHILAKRSLLDMF
mmetsp:Transcript_23983/g.58619  ORF Transcript_23983/g.58619 Transcript_23983/m.58619 type:complete len:213 (-) Transcript_23983:712-1350(-)